MREKHDVVVVGAGCAGTVFSTRMASRGFSVLLLDRNREDELGNTTCDLVENEAFEVAGVPPPVPPEACSGISGIDVVSPDNQSRIHVTEFPYAVVNRRLFARRLLELAREAGVEVIPQCIASGVDIENGYVVAVNTDRGSFPCALAVCASGLDRVLCRDLPMGMGIPRRLRTDEYISAYRETRNLGSDEQQGSFDRGLFEYHVGRYGGYSWVFAGMDGKVDIGTGVQDVSSTPDPREIVLGFIRSHPQVGEDIVFRGGGRIPTRRPLNSMVASGIMVIGDAACQATPIIGRGVGGAMTGGALASDAASFAVEAGDVSIGGLWSYNHAYMKERGAQMAALDCLRILMQRITAEEISWTMAKGIINEPEITGALLGRFEVPDARSKLRGLLRGFRDVPLLVRFENALRLSQKVHELYLQYPRQYDPPEFAEWSESADYLFEDASSL